MPHLNRLLAILVLLGLAGGCTVAKISGRGSVPLMLNTPSEQVQLIRSFTAQKMITFDYTGAFDVSEILTDELQQTGADAITNITITIKSNFQSEMINLLTIGLANARVFSVQGDLVDVEGDWSSLLDAHEVIAISWQIDELPFRKADSHTSLLRLDEGFAMVKSTLI